MSLLKSRTVRGVTISYDELENIDRVVKKNMPKDLDVEYKVVSSKEKAELRKATPVFSGVLNYFPDAIKYVSKASYVGQQQHNPDKPLAWDRSKSGDELDALTRHLIDHSTDPMDDDGVLHLGKVAWRALAALQKHIEDNPQ
jgi:hypothetical protein